MALSKLICNWARNVPIFYLNSLINADLLRQQAETEKRRKKQKKQNELVYVDNEIKETDDRRCENTDYQSYTRSNI